MIHGFDVYRMYLALKQHFSNPNYDYLLNMPIHTFTEETIQKLEKEHLLKNEEYLDIQNKSIKDFWKYDLDKIN